MPRSRHTPGSITRRGASFLVRFCVGGERYWFTVKTKDQKVAEVAARAKYDELEKRQERQRAGVEYLASHSSADSFSGATRTTAGSSASI